MVLWEPLLREHQTNSEIRKIKLLPIELRRPSILRASGHTFEYLGYGPGNYSTGLPQVQVKTLSEDEEFLSQSQETAGGTVLYTGMDSTFNADTRFNAQLIVNNNLRVTGTVDFRSTNNATACNDSNAAEVLGGVGIAKDVHICGTIIAGAGISITDSINVNNNIVAAGGTFGNIQIAITNDNTIDTTSGNLVLNSTGGTLDINDNVDISGTLEVGGRTELNGIVDVDNDFAVRSGTTDKFTVASATGNTNIEGTLTADGAVNFNNTTQSTNTTSGALIVDGGVGIAKDLRVGGTIHGNVTGDLTGTATQIRITDTNT